MSKMITWIAQHRKLIVYVLGAALVALQHQLGTTPAWLPVVLAVLTGVGINQVPNRPQK